MTKTVVGSFDTFEHAHDCRDRARGHGRAAGRPERRRQRRGRPARRRRGAGPSAGVGAADRTDGALPDADPSEGGDTGAGTAASGGAGRGLPGVIGGTAGLIAGLAGLAIPGIGPLVAAGPIAAALTGAGIVRSRAGYRRAALGRRVGHRRAVLRRGRAARRCAGDRQGRRRERAAAIADAMRRHGAIDIESRVAAWRASGWSGFDEAADPWTHERIESERLADRSGGGSPPAIDRGEDTDLRSGTVRGTPLPGALVGTTAGADPAGTGTTTGTPGGGGLAPGRELGPSEPRHRLRPPRRRHPAARAREPCRHGRGRRTRLARRTARHRCAARATRSSAGSPATRTVTAADPPRWTRTADRRDADGRDLRPPRVGRTARGVGAHRDRCRGDRGGGRRMVVGGGRRGWADRGRRVPRRAGTARPRPSGRSRQRLRADPAPVDLRAHEPGQPHLRHRTRVQRARVEDPAGVLEAVRAVLPVDDRQQPAVVARAGGRHVRRFAEGQVRRGCA